jgi:hypothetical protein
MEFSLGRFIYLQKTFFYILRERATLGRALPFQEQM